MEQADVFSQALPWLAGAAVVGAVMVGFWWLSRKAEAGVRRAAEGLAEEQVARYLAKRIGRPEEVVRGWLQAATPPGEAMDAYRQHIDEVFMEFGRVNKACTFAVRIERGGETVFKTSCAYDWDDLPDPVQDAFLHGKSQAVVTWSPSFLVVSQTQEARV